MQHSKEYLASLAAPGYEQFGIFSMIRVCPLCGKSHYPSRVDKVYCSYSCQQKAAKVRRKQRQRQQEEIINATSPS